MTVKPLSGRSVIKCKSGFYFLYTDCEESKQLHVRSSKCRSSFSVEQVLHLERVFERQKYLGSRDRQRLAEQLQMTETQVKETNIVIYFDTSTISNGC